MKKILSLIITFVLIVSMSISTFASPTPFITDPLTDEEEAAFIENSFVKKIDRMDWSNPIKSFDVNENQMILLLFSRSSEYVVCVYNTDFQFQYGFSFHAYGTVTCEWSGNDIMIYFVRSSIYAQLNKNGQWTKLSKVHNSFENNDLVNKLLNKEKPVTIENTTYKVQNDMGLLNYIQSNKYSQLIKIDENNNETILYDVNNEQTIRTVFVLIIIISFVAIVLFKILNPIFKNNKKRKTTEQ